MSEEQMSGTVQESAPEEQSGDTPYPSDDARAILDTQVQILQQMNDELLRTARDHVVLVGGIVTIISVINVNLFLPNSKPVTWFLGFVISSFSSYAWYNHLSASRLSYTNLSIGVHPDLESVSRLAEDTPEEPDGRTQRILRKMGLVAELLSTFTWGHITAKRYEERTDRREAVKQMLSEDYLSAIEQNSWVLTTREKYLNAVQRYLYGTFLLMVLGIALMVVS